ncbi:MAG: glycoside hydrolase family 43 protein, partial [Acidobacteriota bacterium]
MRPSPISKLFRFLALAAGAAALASCAAEPESASRAQGDGVFEEALTASFDRFEYRGSDAVFDRPLSADQYRNPILAGFYPDPSVVRVGDEYYMTHSTFGFYPGLPVFKSRDLVHWVQIGNAIDRPEMMDFTGMHLGWNGLYAPTLEYHRGSFYIINTCVGCGGNFVISASDPAGPWSDPVWISEIADVGGIDPQMFFENDRVFIVNHEMPEGPELYDGHRALWIREVDPQTYEILGMKKMIVDGGINHLVEKPGYVEGPHLYKVGDFYYLSAPEGGTGLDHRQTIYRAGDVWGPYEPYANNPILTQRTLDPARPDPITSTGHADMVETQNGEWWAVFLGTRNYDTIHFATGRETFLLPVTWTDDGWPVILEAGLEVPYIS